MTDAEYVEWLEGFEEWYQDAVTRWHILLMACRSTSVVTAILSAFLAALMTPDLLPTFKWVTTASSLGGAAASHALAEFRVVKMEGLREEGRAEAQHLVSYARDKLEQFKDDAPARFKLKDEIRERIRRLEETQGREFSRVHQGDASSAHLPGAPAGMG